MKDTKYIKKIKVKIDGKEREISVRTPIKLMIDFAGEILINQIEDINSWEEYAETLAKEYLEIIIDRLKLDEINNDHEVK